MYWLILAGQTVVRYKVPLIIWGAHQALEQVGMFSHEHEVEMSRRYRKDHDLQFMVRFMLNVIKVSFAR